MYNGTPNVRSWGRAALTSECHPVSEWVCACRMGWFTALWRDNRTGLHKGCSSSPGLMCCVSVLVFYESYTCYKENGGPFCKDRRCSLFPTVISMPGAGLCNSDEVLIKQEMNFPVGGKGQSHPVTSRGCSVAWCPSRSVSCSGMGSLLSLVLQ